MDELTDLGLQQEGMIARRQLYEYAVDADRVRNEIAARRWVDRTPRVISTFTGELTQKQMEWLAVLHSGPGSMLANLSAAGRHGLTSWERPWVSVIVDDELSFEPVEEVDLFRSSGLSTCCGRLARHPGFRSEAWISPPGGGCS